MSMLIAKPKCIALAGKPLNIPKLNQKGKKRTKVEMMSKNKLLYQKLSLNVCLINFE